MALDIFRRVTELLNALCINRHCWSEKPHHRSSSTSSHVYPERRGAKGHRRHRQSSIWLRIESSRGGRIHQFTQSPRRRPPSAQGNTGAGTGPLVPVLISSLICTCADSRPGRFQAGVVIVGWRDGLELESRNREFRPRGNKPACRRASQ